MNNKFKKGHYRFIPVFYYENESGGEVIGRNLISYLLLIIVASFDRYILRGNKKIKED